MNTCKMCKHWGNDPKDEERFKTCCSPIIKFGYGVIDDDVVPDNGAIVENDVGWGIMTGPDFGCVLHEMKDGIEVSEINKIGAFIKEVIAVSKKHGLSISHEDDHGAFMIEKFSEENASWLRDASDATGRDS